MRERAAALDGELEQLRIGLATAQARTTALESQQRINQEVCSERDAALERVSSLALQLQALGGAS